jgi:hypothetical protein
MCTHGVHTHTHTHTHTHPRNLPPRGPTLLKYFACQGRGSWRYLDESVTFSICLSTGTHCELFKDPCANVSCLNGGTCDSEGLNGTCICAPGFTGEWFISRVLNLTTEFLQLQGQKSSKSFRHRWLQNGNTTAKYKEDCLDDVYFKTTVSLWCWHLLRLSWLHFQRRGFVTWEMNLCVNTEEHEC